MRNLVVTADDNMSRSVEKDNKVAVVVLGDYGRSPRMQYHTLSLVEQVGITRVKELMNLLMEAYVTQAKKEVHVVGYGDSTPHISLLHNKKVFLHYLPPRCVSICTLKYPFVQMASEYCI